MMNSATTLYPGLSLGAETTRDTGMAMIIARKAMIDSQLRTSGVNTDYVLARMGHVAREDFVPVAARSTAYIDRAIPLGGGRFLGAPVMHGKMLEAADPQPDDKVLLVDGGSGYFAELIRPMVASVTITTPEQAIAKPGSKDSYSLLVIDGAIEALPGNLATRLDDRARIVTGTVDRGVTRISTGRKVGTSVSLMPLIEMGVPHLPAFDTKKNWTF